MTVMTPKRLEVETSIITLTAFRWVPPFAQGLSRDLRVRWALEEAGLAYRTRQIDFPDQDTPEHRSRQPFGQVPVYEEDGLTLFESGAIVMHIAERSPALMPGDAAGRARARTWVFAALNTVEVAIQPLAEIDLFHASEDWAQARRPRAEERVRQRLRDLAARLDGRDWLEDRFTAGDLMMAAVLKILRHTELVAAEPAVAAYLARCQARPAFARAERDHLAAFERR
jgi:glutathione S-transferase